MAIGTDVIKTAGRLIFDLERNGERTSRVIEIAYPKTDTEGDELQNLVNAANTTYTTDTMQYFVQPANWRDNNNTELQWRTTQVSYEIVTTTTTPITPETPSSLASAQQESQEQSNQDWQG